MSTTAAETLRNRCREVKHRVPDPLAEPSRRLPALRAPAEAIWRPDRP